MAAGGAACFALYVGLWTAQTLLVRGAVRPNGSYAFDTATVCFFIELLKLAGALLAIALGCDGAASEPRACARVRRALANAPASVPFALPSLLYAGYNLLQFVNLSLVPAPAFRTAINVKVLFTALLARCALPAAQLRGAQWLALLLLALGCAVAQLDERLHPISPGAFGLICLQGGLSSLAGVYTQWLLQLGAPPASGGGGGSGSGSGGGSGMRRECGQTASFGFWERGAFLYAWGAATNGLFLGEGCAPHNCRSSARDRPRGHAALRALPRVPTRRRGARVQPCFGHRPRRAPAAGLQAMTGAWRASC